MSDTPSPDVVPSRHLLIGGDLDALEYAIADYVAKWGENWTGQPYLGEFGPNIAGMPVAVANMAMTVIRKNLAAPDVVPSDTDLDALEARLMGPESASTFSWALRQQLLAAVRALRVALARADATAESAVAIRRTSTAEHAATVEALRAEVEALKAGQPKVWGRAATQPFEDPRLAEISRLEMTVYFPSGTWLAVIEDPAGGAVVAPEETS